VLVVGAAEMLEKGTVCSFILDYLLDYLYGSCFGCSLHLSDFQVPTHGEMITLVPKSRNPRILSATKTMT
jgi:hypothetical protein